MFSINKPKNEKITVSDPDRRQRRAVSAPPRDRTSRPAAGGERTAGGTARRSAQARVETQIEAHLEELIGPSAQRGRPIAVEVRVVV